MTGEDGIGGRVGADKVSTSVERAWTQHLAAEFLSKIPSHQAELTITHNPHFNNHETVAQYIDCTFGRKLDEDDWVSLEERDKAVAANEIWECQWYPNTPVGFNYLAASSLSALLEGLAKVRASED